MSTSQEYAVRAGRRPVIRTREPALRRIFSKQMSLGLTDFELMEASGVSKATIASYRSGIEIRQWLAKVRKLAEALGMKIVFMAVDDTLVKPMVPMLPRGPRRLRITSIEEIE